MQKQLCKLKTYSKAIISLLVLSVTVALVAEGFARILGFQPSPVNTAAEVSPLVELDDRIGWRLKPGVVDVPAKNGTIRYSVLNDGTRSVYGNEEASVPNRDTVLLLGDSFVMGIELNQEDTMAAKLSKKIPSHKIVNGGVFGYGPQQVLLRFRELLRDSTAPISHALYLFPAFHELRAVAPPIHLWRIALESKSRSASMPYCTLNNEGKLVWHEPEVFNVGFELGVSHSGLVSALFDGYYTITSSGRHSQQREVTKALVKEMIQESATHHIPFGALLVGHDASAEMEYTKLLTEHGAKPILSRPDKATASSTTEDNWHPGARLQNYWADLILEKFIVGTDRNVHSSDTLSTSRM
jgi:hypothetical protein